MSDTRIARHKTAITRADLSRPLTIALGDGLLPLAGSVFDFGCGRGDDVRHLRLLGYEANGWDPGHCSSEPICHADVVNIGYVVNVIEDPSERADALRSAWLLADGLLIVSARMTWEARGLAGRLRGDGLVTRTGTFQKFFDQPELAQWIERTLGVEAHAAAPGVFYVFRDPAAAQAFVASRVYVYRPRASISPQARYDANQETLAPLLHFMRKHARPPRRTELPAVSWEAIIEGFGSIGRAVRVIRQVTGESYWDVVASHRASELLVYIALSRFGHRPRFSQLDPVLGADIRCSFGAYQEACRRADRLLLACGDQTTLYLSARGSPVGKQTPSSLYVHRSAMAEVSALLQVYEGCARVLVGTVQDANVVKLSAIEPKVSFLSYPGFDRDPHPTLRTAVTVDLRKLTVEWRNYSRSENPPLLHRKEEFITKSDPRRSLYERLTASEQRAGLYAHPERIGALKGWLATLDEAGLRLAGHRLIRREDDIQR